MSTVALSEYGLLSTSCSVLFFAVQPSAKYHVGDVWVAHDVTASPADVVARCSTMPSPPSISTNAATNGPLVADLTSSVSLSRGGATSVCTTAATVASELMYVM